MENFWHIHCLKCQVQNKLQGEKGLRKVYVRIGLPVCIINLLIAPIANFLIRLGV